MFIEDQYDSKLIWPTVMSGRLNVVKGLKRTIKLSVLEEIDILFTLNSGHGEWENCTMLFIVSN
jgi:hypothetical protein